MITRPPRHIESLLGKVLTIHEYEGEDLSELIKEVKAIHGDNVELEIHCGFVRVNVWSTRKNVVKEEPKPVEKKRR